MMRALRVLVDRRIRSVFAVFLLDQSCRSYEIQMGILEIGDGGWGHMRTAKDLVYAKKQKPTKPNCLAGL